MTVLINTNTRIVDEYRKDTASHHQFVFVDIKLVPGQYLSPQVIADHCWSLVSTENWNDHLSIHVVVDKCHHKMYCKS